MKYVLAVESINELGGRLALKMCRFLAILFGYLKNVFINLNNTFMISSKIVSNIVSNLEYKTR